MIIDPCDPCNGRPSVEIINTRKRIVEFCHVMKYVRNKSWLKSRHFHHFVSTAWLLKESVEKIMSCHELAVISKAQNCLEVCYSVYP